MQTQSYVPAGLLVVMSICTEMSRETFQLWDVQDSFVWFKFFFLRDGSI